MHQTQSEDKMERKALRPEKTEKKTNKRKNTHLITEFLDISIQILRARSMGYIAKAGFRRTSVA